MKKLLLLISVLLYAFGVCGQNIVLYEAPESYQLFARNDSNEAKVVCRGQVQNTDFQNIELRTYRDGKLIGSEETELEFRNSKANFLLSSNIEAGLYQYKIELVLISVQDRSVDFSADSIVCGDAFIITGQSNSHASSSASTFSSPYCRSFGVKTGYEPYTSDDMKSRWGRATGNAPDLKGVGGWWKKNAFGVGVWGMHLMEQIVKNQKIPVCIINGGSGASSIEKNMPATYQGDLNTSFGRLIYRVHEAGLTHGIKAILWHQGESNSNDNFRSYTGNFDILYQAWKSNFPTLQKVYMFQIHPGCGGKFQSQFRDLQVKIADKYNDVEIMSTLGLPGHDGCHYTHEGYLALAERIYPTLSKDFYDQRQTKSNTAPKLVRAYYSNLVNPEICLEFNQAVQWTAEQQVDDSTYFLKDYFFDREGQKIPVLAGKAHKNKVYLTVSSTDLSHITYLPGHHYPETKICYNGPWILGQNGIGALSFHRFRIFNKHTTYKNFPAALQLFPRNQDNQAIINIEGSLFSTGYEKAICKVFRNQRLIEQMEEPLIYVDGVTSFSFDPIIKAELAEYSIETGFIADGSYFKDRSAHNVVCGDVYLINGQSNSHPTRGEAIYRNEFCRSFGSNTNYSAYNPSDTTWGLAAGDISQKYHVSAWGIRLMQQIVEKYQIPVCIINGGSGGSSIEYNLPPQTLTDLNSTYNRLYYRTVKAKVHKAVKAILWHQGESNSREANYQNYAANFDSLYRGWKTDYPAIKKVFVFQIHPGCGGDRQSELRETQRRLGRIYEDVEIMSTLGLIGHDGCHYTNAGYSQMGEWIFPMLEKAFYNPDLPLTVSPADISKAYYSVPGKEICLVFNQNLQNDKLSQGTYLLKDQFYLDGKYGQIASIKIQGKKVYLETRKPVEASKITYLPGHFYEGTKDCYQGPWLRGVNGIGALSFHDYVIQSRE